MSNGDKPPAVIVTVTGTNASATVVDERVYVIPCGKANPAAVIADVDAELTALIHRYEDAAKT